METKIRYVDLDGTLAEFFTWEGFAKIGKPVPAMVKRVKNWLNNGDRVVIFTSRLSPTGEYIAVEDLAKAKDVIQQWCLQYLGQELEVTCNKGVFDKFYDDKGEHIEQNTGYTREELLLQAINSMRKTKNSNDSGILSWVITYLEGSIIKQNS